jgi:GMP synthase-like glutamine amidotransferase
VSWVSALKSFILRVYNDHPHVKIFGVGFGSQITAEALGGTVEKMNFGRIFIGKESIEMKKSFFEDNKFVVKVLEDICSQLNVDKTALEGQLRTQILPTVH